MVLLQRRPACTRHPGLDAIARRTALLLHVCTPRIPRPRARCPLPIACCSSWSLVCCSPARTSSSSHAPTEPPRMRRLARRDCSNRDALVYRPRARARAHVHALALALARALVPGRRHRRRDAA